MTAPALQPKQPASPELDRYAVLDALEQQAKRIAELIMGQIEALVVKEPVPTPESVQMLERLTRSHARVARTARLSDLLKDRLKERAAGRDKAALADRAAETRVRKAMIVGVVERIAIEADVSAPYALGSAARRRLDRDDIYGDVLKRPASEIVAGLCDDLDLDPVWSKRAVEAWAREEIESGEPGWPMAAFTAAPIAVTRTFIAPASIANDGPDAPHRSANHAAAAQREQIPPPSLE